MNNSHLKSGSSGTRPSTASHMEYVPSICLVLCYVGPLPNYFATFLAASENNEDVDFLIFSDQRAPESLGSNIRWVQTSKSTLRERFSRAIGMPVVLDGGYKICDYKPVFGKAFARELEGYDFWGFVDPDLLWGHIRSFATTERLGRFDILSFRGRGYISGPCTIFRNDPKINHLFASVPGVEDVYRNPKTRAFTELCGRWKGSPTVQELLDRGEQVSFSDFVREKAARQDIRWLDVDEIVERNPANVKFKFEWRDGCLYQISENRHEFEGGGREVLMYHYVSAKEDPGFYIPERRRLPSRFLVTHQGVFVPSETMSKEWLVFQSTRLASLLRRQARRQANRARDKLRQIQARSWGYKQ